MMPRSRGWYYLLYAALGCLCSGPLLSAQAPSEETVFRTETRLLEVEVKVTDREGRPVTDLKQEDFTLLEDGQPQTISVFEFIATPTERNVDNWVTARLAEQPLSREQAESILRRVTWIYIVSQGGFFERPRTYQAIREFIEENLRPGVMISLAGMPFTADRQALLNRLAAMTRDRKGAGSLVDYELLSQQEDQRFLEAMLLAADRRAEEFGMPELSSKNALQTLPEIVEAQNQRMQMQDLLRLTRRLGRLPGKKAIVAFAPPFVVNKETVGLVREIEAEALRSRVSWYPVDARGLAAGSTELQADFGLIGVESGGGMDLPSLLTEPLSATSLTDLHVLADISGGQAVIDDNKLGKIFDRMYEDRGDYYVLGYSPGPAERRGKRHKVRIEVNRPDVRLSYRRGYTDDAELDEITRQSRETLIDQIVHGTVQHKSHTTGRAPRSAFDAYMRAYESFNSETPDAEAAIAALKQATAEYKKFAEAWGFLGYLHMIRGETELARVALERATKADPEYMGARANLLRLEMREGRWDRSAKLAGDILKRDPSHGEAQFYLAAASLNRGDLDEAEQTALALSNSPDGDAFPQAHEILGRVHAARGDLTNAAVEFRRFVELRPEAPSKDSIEKQITQWEAADSLAKAREALEDGRWADADALTEPLLAKQPQSAEVLLLRGLAKYHLSEIDAAYKLALAAREADTGAELPQIHHLLALVHEQRGEMAEAAAQLRVYLRNAPDTPNYKELSEREERWRQQPDTKPQDGSVFQVINAFGDVTVRVSRQHTVGIRASSPERASRQGDVLLIESENKAELRVEPSDKARFDVEIDLPYQTKLSVETTNGHISLTGYLSEGEVKTERGDIRLAVPWETTQLHVRTHVEPPEVSVPDSLKVSKRFTGDGPKRFWTMTDRHNKDMITTARIRVEAETPKKVELVDFPIPADAPVKLPWHATKILDGLLDDDVGVRSDVEYSPEAIRDEPAKASQGKQPSGEILFRSDVRMVSLTVSVTDSEGRPVTDLRPDEFEIAEDGDPQTVAAVSASEGAFNLAVLLDMSDSTIINQNAMKGAARGFIGVARPQDHVALYALAHSLFWEVAPLTSNENLLLERVEHLPVLSGLTPLFDAIVTGYAHELAGRPGERNALIVISDGVDNIFSIGRRFKPGVVGKNGLPSQVLYENLLEAAPRLDALLYPVLLMPSFDDDTKLYAGARATRDLFKDLAKATGGKVFTAPSLSSLEPVYDQVAEELRSVYSLGYYPRDQDFDGEWRGVQVKVKREGVVVRTRSGYLAR